MRPAGKVLGEEIPTMTHPDALAAPRADRPITLLDDPVAPRGPGGRSDPPPCDAPAGPRALRTSRPPDSGVVQLRYELNTPRVRHIYRREFEHLDHLLQSLEHSRSFRQVDHAMVDRLIGSVRTAMSDARHLFAATTVRTLQLLAQHQLSEIPIHYSAPLAVCAPISSPHAREYLETLVDADDTFACLERAWLLGLVDSQSRSADEGRLKKALREIGLSVRRSYSEMARHLRPSDNAGTMAACVTSRGQTAAGE